MTAHLTAAQLRELARHLTPDQVERLGPVIEQSKPRKRTTRQALPRDRGLSICVTCTEQFDTDAAEVRHLTATGHSRYLSVTWTDCGGSDTGAVTP